MRGLPQRPPTLRRRSPLPAVRVLSNKFLFFFSILFSLSRVYLTCNCSRYSLLQCVSVCTFRHRLSFRCQMRSRKCTYSQPKKRGPKTGSKLESAKQAVRSASQVRLALFWFRVAVHVPFSVAIPVSMPVELTAPSAVHSRVRLRA
jgi:hypothetical protein